MNNLHFTEIEAHFGYGEIPETGWLPLAEADLLVLVGVTGVGKSRTVEELSNAGLSFTLLPNRRVLTDHLIIGALQRLDSDAYADQAPPIVRDRKERFAYTRRYRERYAGGMAHALTTLCIRDSLENKRLLFDGLRGVNEVECAARLLPKARFIALSAPDGVRIERLLGRNDAFDQIDGGQTSHTDTKSAALSLAERFPDAANIQISRQAEQKLLSLLDKQAVSNDDMAAKLAIVSEERRNYDPDATIAALQTAAPDRLCVVDTVENGPEECAAQIMAWLA